MRQRRGVIIITGRGNINRAGSEIISRGLSGFIGSPLGVPEIKSLRFLSVTNMG